MITCGNISVKEIIGCSAPSECKCKHSDLSRIDQVREFGRICYYECTICGATMPTKTMRELINKIPYR